MSKMAQPNYSEALKEIKQSLQSLSKELSEIKGYVGRLYQLIRNRTDISLELSDRQAEEFTAVGDTIEEINTNLITEIIQEYWNECDWLEFSTEKYDHKRGYATLSTEVMVPYSEVVNAEDWMLTGWTAVVKTDLGTLEIK